MGDDPLIVRRGPWKFVWRGGRLADVFHEEFVAAIDCVQVDGWKSERDVNSNWGHYWAPQALGRTADRWMRDSMPDYQKELPWMR